MRRAAVVCPVLGLLTSCVAHGQVLQYTITELRHPEAGATSNSYATDVNNRGEVCGMGRSAQTGAWASVWFNGAHTALPDGEGFEYSSAWAINEAGLVVGQAGTPAGLRAIVWDVNGPVLLPPLHNQSQSRAKGVNAAGVVCGMSQISSGGDFFAVSWTDGVPTYLGDIPGGTEESNAYGINDLGQVVGDSVASNERDMACLFDDGAIIQLGDLPGGHVDSTAYEISNSGATVGFSYVSITSEHAFLWRSGTMTDLGDLPGGWDESEANAVNESGQVAGSSSSVYRGANCDSVFLWTERTGMFDLRPRLNVDQWSSLSPYGMNDKGWIVGEGQREYSPNLYRYSAFLIKPVTTVVAPSSFAVQFGKVDAGSVASLAAVDGNALRVCRFVVVNNQVAPVTFTADAALPFTPMNLWARATARMTVSGSFGQTLSFYDWQAGLFDAADATTAPLTTAFSLQECIAKGQILRYVGVGNSVRVRVQVRATGPAASSAWCSEHDELVFEAVPEP